MSYVDRIRSGDVLPWVGDGADGARRSAQIVADEAATLARDDPRQHELSEQYAAWLARAATLDG